MRAWASETLTELFPDPAARKLAVRIALALIVGIFGAVLVSGILVFAAWADTIHDAKTGKTYFKDGLIDPPPPERPIPYTTATVAGRDVAVTVYKDNLGVVKDRRRFGVPSGESEIRFTEVASLIDPTSVHLRPAGRGGEVAILYQDYRYDLASTDKLLEKYVDQQIDVATKDDQVKRGTLLAFDPSSLVIQEPGGSVSLLNRAEVRQVGVRELPKGLITRPTLVWRVRATGGGERDLEVSYMTGGMDWHAEYVAVLEESGLALELQGWASVENHSGATYEDAKLKLIAGTIHRAPVARPMPYALDARMMKAEGVAQVEERGFFEYHLYELPQRATLSNNEVKQVGLMHATGIKAVRKFTYDGSADQDHVQVRMEFQNDAASGLGMPLPEGTIRAFQRDTDGSLELVGEDRIQHTPKNQTVRVAIGDAFDVAAERKQTDVRQISSKVNEVSYEILLTNHRKDAVEVTVIEHAEGQWDIVRSSVPQKKKDSRTFEFAVRCEPEKPVTVAYTIRTRLP